jgi:hypothetical protein
MITKTIQITKVTVDELADKVADKLMLKIENYLKELSKKQDILDVLDEQSINKKR